MFFGKKIGFNEKAQSSSPFELLVAIIMMGFVIIIGSQMISSANHQVCLANVDKSMVEFKSMLEDTVTFRTSNKFDFRPNSSNCYKETKSTMKIEAIRNNPRYCGSICGKAIDSCFVMIFYTDSIANASKQKCLNLPPYTSFLWDNVSCPTNTESLSGYKAIDPTKPNTNLSSGSYVLVNVAAAGDTYSKICTYVRK
ncbi:MAG: hypothetical protein PHX27_02870 [Candidatus ainarchaeum sp.]|nr:hypothetical protein [Candidatus ainarchaeum sp.]